MPQLLDNKSQCVWDYLKNALRLNTDKPLNGTLNIVSAYFTIDAIINLAKKFPESNPLNLILSQFINYDASDAGVNLIDGDLDPAHVFSVRNEAKRAANFLNRDNVVIKMFQNAFCHAKSYIFQQEKSDGNNFYVTGSSNFTGAGLGIRPASSNIELNIADTYANNPETFKQIHDWFQGIWSHNAKITTDIIKDPDNPNAQISVKQFFIRQIEKYFHAYTPEQIYMKILFELFSVDLQETGVLDDNGTQPEMTNLSNSLIWDALYTYQRIGVTRLIAMMKAYGGAILADAVGLGKTFSALAVIKYHLSHGYRVVVFCPKKLQHNWEQYQYGKGSRFDADNFDYRVRFHTDLQDNRLNKYNNDYAPDYLQNQDKVLYVIDESHNLRNTHSGRFLQLIDLIKNAKQGQDCRTLLLSATPINNGFNDLEAQVNIIAHANDQAFKDTLRIPSIQRSFANAQREFNQWCKDTHSGKSNSIADLCQRLKSDFFNINNAVIIARTRKLIESTLGANLHFPQKENPVNHFISIDHIGRLSTNDIYDALDNLHLSAYQPSHYVDPSETIAEEKAIQQAHNDQQGALNSDFFRERFLVAMMRVLFLKRLESSWHSCLLTIDKVLDVHKKTLERVDAFILKHNDDNIDNESGNDDIEDELNETLGKKTSHPVRLADLQNIDGFKKALTDDIQKLTQLHDAFSQYQDDFIEGDVHDEKLDTLEALIRHKQTQDNPKLVIFTSYSDTARFLFNQLRARGISHLALISGQEVDTTGDHRCVSSDFNNLLQSFAPYSKLYLERDWSALYRQYLTESSTLFNEAQRRWDVPYETWRELIAQHRPDVDKLISDPIDVLICTDCLSEGQNLQDADMQVNFDIHWNPVRLIQRFGRIDRIGSRSETIKCVNFWPTENFDKYLQLKERVQNRMASMTLVGSEVLRIDDGFCTLVKNDELDKRNTDHLLEQLKNTSFADLDDADSPTNFSISDLSLEEFKQELMDYFSKQRDTFRNMPPAIFSGFRSDNFRHDSLVAVLGFPKRSQTDKGKTPYQKILLICQPIAPDAPEPTLNDKQILTYLRSDKTKPRTLPAWIDTETPESSNGYQSLKNTITSALNAQIAQTPSNATSALRSGGIAALKAATLNNKAENTYNINNCDLIVWEYITSNSHD